MSITESQLASIVPTLKGDKLKAVCASLNAGMEAGGITDPKVVAMFLAQIIHESGAFYYTEEIASGAAYEGRKDLGNTEKGDGVKFKGRGWIQITGRDNYTQISKHYDVDFVENPELLETPEWCGKSAVWFWNSRKLSTLAASGDEAAFKKVTQRINGGQNGYNDRKKYWLRAKAALGV